MMNSIEQSLKEYTAPGCRIKEYILQKSFLQSSGGGTGDGGMEEGGEV